MYWLIVKHSVPYMPGKQLEVIGFIPKKFILNFYYDTFEI